ncbi:MAG: hypothetical protein A2Z08_11445 [Deltaproteobacteria bacterium RBG_16_54_11]|nr:MAG: hypothetical protein A2Z08_11445 [Deltaproteobacteria bacterium RBG_16_54_11]
MPDLRGRKVTVGSPGSGTLMASRVILTDVCGIPFDAFKSAHLSFTESTNALKDGTIDVGMVSVGHPVPSLLNLARQIHFRLIPYSDEEMNALIAKNPDLMKVVIPRGTYQGIDTDTLTRGSVICLFCRQDLNEELVYKTMKALFEHPEEKDMIHPQAKQWNLNNVFRGADYIVKYILFHPGAVKYLKEKASGRGNSRTFGKTRAKTLQSSILMKGGQYEPKAL